MYSLRFKLSVLTGNIHIQAIFQGAVVAYVEL